jgi:hypothetical protein
MPDTYHGCFLYHFSNLDLGALERNYTGLKIVTTINGTTGSFNGACTYHADLKNAGAIYSQLDMASKPPSFQIYATGERL